MPRYEYHVTLTISSPRPIVYCGHDTPAAVALWIDDKIFSNTVSKQTIPRDIQITRTVGGQPDPLWAARTRTV